MVLRILTLAIAQVLDLVTFSLMVGRHGIGAEANPLVAQLFVSSGMDTLTAGKVALIVLIASLVVAAASQRSRLWSVIGAGPLALAIGAGLIGGITNTAAYLH